MPRRRLRADHPSQIPSGQPTARAGLTNGDVILSLGSTRIDNSTVTTISDDLHAATKASQGRPTTVVYRSSDGDTHTATITPELVVYTNIAQGVLPNDLTGQALVITAVNGEPTGTGDPAALLAGTGGVAVTAFAPGLATRSPGPRRSRRGPAGERRDLVSGFVEGSPATKFTSVALSGVSDGDGSQVGYTAAWRIGFLAQTPGAPLLQAVGDGFGVIPTYVTGTLGVLGQLFVHPTVAAQQLSGRSASPPRRAPASSRDGCSSSG